MSFFKGDAASKSSTPSFFGRGNAKKSETSQSNTNSSNFSQIIPQSMASFLTNFHQTVYQQPQSSYPMGTTDQDDVESMTSCDDSSKMSDVDSNEGEVLDDVVAYGKYTM